MIIKVINDMVYDSDIGKWLIVEEYNNYIDENSIHNLKLGIS